jgi:methyl-accepting chemotaxis protein
MALDMTTALTIKANVKGEEQLRGLQKGLNQLSGQSKKTAGAMDRLKNASKGALGALRTLLPVLGVAAFAKMGNDVLQLGDQLEKMSRSTGLTVPLLDKLRQSAALAGTDFKALQRAFPTLAKNMQDASDGVGTAKDAFDRLGFSVTDNQGNLKDLDTAFLELTDKFKGMEDGTMKAANAAEIFGTGLGRKLIPLLNQGSDAINGLETGFTQLSAERMAAFNDSMAQLGEKFRIVAIQVMEALLPALQTLVHLLDGLAKIFNAIPGPIKQLAVSFGVLVIAVKALGVAALITQGAMKGLAALKLGGLLGGWAGSMGPVIAGFVKIGGLIKILGVTVAAVFTGPAAPFILAGAAVVGLIAAFVKFKFLREIFVDLGKQIAQLATNIGKGFGDLFKNIVKAGGNFINAFKERWKKVKDIIIAPFKAAIEWIPNKLKGMIDSVTRQINKWWSNIMGKIRRGRAASRSNSSSSSSGGSVRGYAEGGYVQGPQLAVVGEGKAGGEYIVPSHKMGGFINNYLSGLRGGAAIPRFAEGGFVSGGSPNINIKTGPVMQMSNGQQYVTVNDLQSALSSFSASVFSNSRTAGGRRFQGIS